MKRHPSLIPLSHDHQRGLALAVMIDRRSKPDEELARKAQAMWRDELQPHFAIEERDVFPLAAGQEELTVQLVAEHRELERLALAVGQGEDLRGELEAFGRRLSEHIRTEERRLFEAMQDTLDEQAIAEMGRKIAAAHRPSTCELT